MLFSDVKPEKAEIQSNLSTSPRFCFEKSDFCPSYLSAIYIHTYLDYTIHRIDYDYDELY